MGSNLYLIWSVTCMLQHQIHQCFIENKLIHNPAPQPIYEYFNLETKNYSMYSDDIKESKNKSTLNLEWLATNSGLLCHFQLVFIISECGKSTTLYKTFFRILILYNLILKFHVLPKNSKFLLLDMSADFSKK